jgi:hypothetical protein
MQIIESTSELQTFNDIINQKVSYWYPVWVDDTLHPKNTKLAFLFIWCGDDYIIPINHGDCNNLDIKDVEQLFTIDGDKWVFQKKKLLQSLKIDGRVLDIDTANFLQTQSTIEYRTHFETLYQKWKSKGYYDNLNQSIPILKLGEVLQEIVPQYQKLDKETNNFKWYNDVYIPLLSEIEIAGISVVPQKFIDRWPSNQKQIHQHPQGPVVYTEYNPYTSTGRPSNRHGGINFSALNKSDGTRECFVPPSGCLFLQMDYDAYHPRIIGKLIGYELPKTSVHQWLADQYGCSYEESKGITFQLLYGGVPDEFLEIPYYKKVSEYINKLWEDVKKYPYIKTKHREIPLSWVEDPNPQKVFNYLLQAMETELNVEIMVKLKNEELPLPILYTYDSFLFEFDDSELETIKKVKFVLESYGFPIKASWGSNYSKV